MAVLRNTPNPSGLGTIHSNTASKVVRGAAMGMRDTNWQGKGGVILAILLIVSPVAGQPPAVPEDEGPLFNRLDINPQGYAALGVGASFSPGLPGLPLLSVLY